MAKLVSVDQAKTRLRIDTDVGDTDIELMISAASAEIIGYLQGTEFDWTDSYGDPAEVDSDGVGVGVPDDIQDACLMYVGIKNKNRDKVEGVEWDQGALPSPVISMLRRHWTPSV